MAVNPQHIPFIHNYCDRWCERCCFTTRCSVYENTKDDTPEEQDMHNRAFWNKLSKNFQQAIQLLQQAAQEYDIDLNNISDEELKQWQEEKIARDESVYQHPLKNLCFKYATAVKIILEDEQLWQEQEASIVQEATLGLQTDEQIRIRGNEIKECHEVISWYLYFISAKLMRALSGKMDAWEEEDEIQNDSNGSAKVALIAVDRSMQAWAQLYEYTKQEAILTVLALLSKIKNATITTFPSAHYFIRPGFDTF